MTSSLSDDAILILAGGRSSRMGCPKDEVVLAGCVTMLGRVLKAVRPLGLNIYLSTSNAPSPAHAATGLPLVSDATPGEGPLAAIGHAFAVLPAQGFLVVCCDQPLLTTALLQRLLDARNNTPTFFSSHEGAPLMPFPGHYPAAMASDIVEALARGERSPSRWATRHECRLVSLAPDECLLTRSFNTQDELRDAGLLTASSAG